MPYTFLYHTTTRVGFLESRDFHVVIGPVKLSFAVGERETGLLYHPDESVHDNNG